MIYSYLLLRNSLIVPRFTTRRLLVPAAALLGLVAIACAEGPPADLVSGVLPDPDDSPLAAASSAAPALADEPALAGIDPDGDGDFSAPFDLLNPTGQKAVDPGEYRKLIARDVIVPVYEPRYVGPEEANLVGQELVMGVEVNGEAKAFPIGLIRNREIVNDTIGGIPLLITW